MQYLQENTCVGVFCEYWEIPKNTYFEEHMLFWVEQQQYNKYDNSVTLRVLVIIIIIYLFIYHRIYRRLFKGGL